LDGERLVKTARKIIEDYLSGRKTPKVGIDGNGGVFVTLKKQGELRGCIGIPAPGPLSERLKEAAQGVTRDPRFPPLELSEMQDTTVEVSVLTKPKPVEDPKKVVVGKDGIIMRRGFNSGLLLPQVPVEQGWTLEEYLDYGCLKAGLPPEAWKDGTAQIFTFQAKVFKEIEPNGEVVEIHQETKGE